jgi:hypothetical protein
MLTALSTLMALMSAGIFLAHTIDAYRSRRAYRA